jgi:O-antigen/teichoic acid export membrane protein
MYGAWFSLVGVVITLAINIIFVPIFSYMASAWAAFVCYFVMMVISYIYGQKYMPIRYDMKSIGLYTGLALILYCIGLFIQTPWGIVNGLMKTVLLFIFIFVLVKRDFPLNRIPGLNRIFK